jgi:hypothetical protein
LFTHLIYTSSLTIQKEHAIQYKESKTNYKCAPILPYTDKKENLIILIYKEIQNGAVAKSYMTNGLLINGEIFGHFLIQYFKKPFLIYDFATAPLEVPCI